jgi:hypothetical protein
MDTTTGRDREREGLVYIYSGKSGDDHGVVEVELMVSLARVSCCCDVLHHAFSVHLQQSETAVLEASQHCLFRPGGVAWIGCSGGDQSENISRGFRFPFPSAASSQSSRLRSAAW